MSTQGALQLSEVFQRRLHVLHLSSGVAAELLGRQKTALVSREVTPQHLLLNPSAYEDLGSLAQMNLPLREEKDNQQLWQALVDGVIYSMAPDHAPHTLREKALPVPRAPPERPRCANLSPLMVSQKHRQAAAAWRM